MMMQAIAGVAPIQDREVTVMTVWPSIAGVRLFGMRLGRTLGEFYAIETGISVLTIGHLICLLSIPLALVLYFKRIGPFVATRYRVTNKRIIVELGMAGKEGKSIELNRFDTIEIEQTTGDRWFDSGDLVFKKGNVETFRLDGVSRPEAFRQVCVKSHQAFVGVLAAVG